MGNIFVAGRLTGGDHQCQCSHYTAPPVVSCQWYRSVCEGLGLGGSLLREVQFSRELLLLCRLHLSLKHLSKCLCMSELIDSSLLTPFMVIHEASVMPRRRPYYYYYAVLSHNWWLPSRPHEFSALLFCQSSLELWLLPPKPWQSPCFLFFFSFPLSSTQPWQGRAASPQSKLPPPTQSLSMTAYNSSLTSKHVVLSSR